MIDLLIYLNKDAAKYDDLAKDILQDFYCCTRDWSAWNHKTMTDDDFVSCFDDADIVSDTIAQIKSIEANAIKSVNGIDLSKLKPNQLKQMKDYYDAILACIND